MNEKKSLAEEALLQMRQVEEVIAENAKGILASTMKEEINQLVKESLSEQEDDDVDMDDDMEEMDTPDMDVDMDDMDSDKQMSDDDVVDLTGASDEEILKVFKAMGEEDGIIIKKDGDDIHLTDNDADTEYLIKLGESMEDEKIMSIEEMDEFEMDADSPESIGADVDQDEVDSILDNLFGESSYVDSEENEGVMYEIEMDEESDEMEESYSEEMDEEDDIDQSFGLEDDEIVYEIEMDEESDEMEESYSEEMDEESDEMEESYSEEMDEESDEEVLSIADMNEESDEMEEDWTNESYSHKKAKKSMKPKGTGIGSGPKFSYKKTTTGGFSEKKKQGPKTMGTGKAKFEYKEGMNMGGKNKMVGKKVEAKEAARTYGMGSKEGRGLRKGITPNRNLKLEALEAEISMLREKNEEYRKALNVFREKLNEVAIFNSNLAYATRLFTEHSTTKKEKINILRRFDGVDTLKESKNLYRSIREELSTGESKSINESVENKLNKTVSTGSSTTLIESKTYENPQFMRIKDLMGKIV